jgi:hypothetical protein
MMERAIEQAGTNGVRPRNGAGGTAKRRGRDPDYRLRKESHAARLLLAGLAEMGLENDDQLLGDAVEGETDLIEAIAAALDGIDEDEVLVAGIEEKLRQLADRKKAAKERIGRRRGLIEQAMAIAWTDQPLRLPSATLSLSRRPRDIVITEEADIPAPFWIPQPPPPPKLDKKALRDRLRSRAEALEEARAITDPQERQAALATLEREHPPVPGCDLDNGGFALTIRRS